MKEVLKLENVWKIYKTGEVEVNALKDFTITIKEGEYLSVLGPSGSGKSTFLHIAGLLDKPTKGRVLFKGKEVSKLDDDELSRIRGEEIGFVFQAFNLIPHLTALENVALPMLIYGYKKKEREKRAIKLLEKLGLGNRINHLPSQLSGGQKQRVAIARALIMNPSIIFADEPTGNLDSKSGKEVIKILNTLNKEGKTIVLVTHDVETAKNAKRIIYIKDGSIEKEVKR